MEKLTARIDENGFDDVFLELGFREVTSGTGMLRYAISIWKPGASMCKQVYPQVAERFGSTPARCERAMRHAIESAWTRGSIRTQEALFGSSINPDSGRPTVSEFVTRMARVCR